MINRNIPGNFSDMRGLHFQNEKKNKNPEFWAVDGIDPYVILF